MADAPACDQAGYRTHRTECHRAQPGFLAGAEPQDAELVGVAGVVARSETEQTAGGGTAAPFMITRVVCPPAALC